MTSPLPFIVLSDLTLLQPGDAQTLRFRFPHHAQIVVSHPVVLKLRLTALCQGHIVDPQPTVLDRLITLTWDDPVAGPFFAAYDAAHAVYVANLPAHVACAGDVVVGFAAQGNFAVVMPHLPYPQRIDAIEITAHLEAHIQLRPDAVCALAPGETQELPEDAANGYASAEIAS